MENNIDLNYLLLGHINGTLSGEEKKQLLDFLSDPGNMKEYNEAMGRLYESSLAGSPAHYDEEVEKMIREILQSEAAPVRIPDVPSQHRIPLLKRTWFRYAAAVVAVALAGYYLWPVPQKIKTGTVAQHQQPAPRNDAHPATSHALLTLSNGEKIKLQTNSSQTIRDGNVAIKNENGVVIYEKSDDVVFNTMSTPKGGQYKLNLPDGTLAWLNAESSVTFPTSFPGKQREVKITGEVYFEVAKDAGKPFVVQTFKDKITVLGTHFNVNAYADEAGIKTTLEEGVVRVNDAVLAPGQAYMKGKVVKTNLAQDLAWRNRIFDFNDCDLETVMRQISRWYDIVVVYKDGIPPMQFYGKMDRDLNLSQVLSILGKSNVHFEIEGKKLIVSP